MTGMFLDVTLSTTNYDNTLIGWNTLTEAEGETQIPIGITSFSGGNSTYCNGEAARESLINVYSWFGLEDGGIDIDCTGLGLDDYDLASSIKLYPNPASIEFRIEGLLENSILEIYNLNGLLVQKLHNYKGNPVDVSELSSTVYFVKISNSNGTVTKRLIIK